MPSDPSQAATNPEVDKLVDRILADMSALMRVAHGGGASQAVEAIHAIKLATMEIGKVMGATPDDPMQGTPDEEFVEGEAAAPGAPSMEPPAEESMEESPSPPPTSFEEAAGQTHNMMMADAARRRAAR